jgi:hypothetical protein
MKNLVSELETCPRLTKYKDQTPMQIWNLIPQPEKDHLHQKCRNLMKRQGKPFIVRAFTSFLLVASFLFWQKAEPSPRTLFQHHWYAWVLLEGIFFNSYVGRIGRARLVMELQDRLAPIELWHPRVGASSRFGRPHVRSRDRAHQSFSSSELAQFSELTLVTDADTQVRSSAKSLPICHLCCMWEHLPPRF